MVTKKDAVAVAPINAMDQILGPKVEITAEDLRKYFAPQATEKEFAIFAMTVANQRLDPSKREVFFIKYGNNPGQIVTGYTVYIKRAERTGKLNGWDAVIKLSNGKPESATVTIYRKDWERPFIWTVEASEFDKGQSTWKAMPGFMLKKVAIAQAFRLAFPDELGGMPYTSDEITVFADDVTAKEALEAAKPVVAEVSPPKPIPTRKIKTEVSPQKPAEQAQPAKSAPEKEQPAPESEQKPEAAVEAPAQQEPAAPVQANPDLLPDAKKQLILKTFSGHGVTKELIESVSQIPYDQWDMSLRNWLIEQYHHIEAGEMDAKDFSALEYHAEAQ